MKKRLFSAITAIALLLSLSPSTFAISASPSYTIVEDDMLASTAAPASSSSNIVTVSEIQSLLNDRTVALLNDDDASYDEITETLRTYGVKEISYEDLPTLLGEAPLHSTFSTPDETYTTENSVFEYYYTTYTYRGTTYDIMRILASPNPNASGDTILYNTDVEILHNSKSSTLIAMELLGIGVESLIGVESVVGAGVSTAGTIALTLFDVIDTVSSGLSTTSRVSNVSATYTWNLAEDCSWVFVSNRGEGNYQLAGCYHKGSMGVSVAVPKLTVNNMDSTAYIDSVNRQITAYPENYDSTYYALDSYVNGSGAYISSITALPVEGIEGQVVTMARLNNPIYPMYAQ